MEYDVSIYDTTLRDGTQSEGVSFSTGDKIRIAKRLDSFGVSYIEGGWPGSNPTDLAFFEEIRSHDLEYSKIAAFGSTRRRGNAAEDDPNLRTLLDADTPVVTIFGKSWLLHVHQVIRATPDENLKMVGSSCRYLADHDREVIFDAEHFFEGYLDDPEYAIQVLKTARKNGASTLVLCDTNGGMLPGDIQRVCAEVKSSFPEETEFGIHCHNDTNCAVANSLVAIAEGAGHVQGTINGIGERCGNVDLCSVIPALELKLGKICVRQGSLKHLAELSRFIADIGNMRLDSHQPYVGASAFAHKGGMHVDAVKKNKTTFEHISPESVGNRRRVLVSDLSGASNILLKAEEHDIALEARGREVRQILTELKRLESEGYEYESADASFKVLLQKLLKEHEPFFDLAGFRVIVEKRGHHEPCLSEATIKVTVNDVTEIAAAEGEGPVNALDLALRKVLQPFYPEIADIRLKDFKVRILDAEDGTAAKTRVLIESGDRDTLWGTVGVSENIIEASWEALVDSVEYALYKDRADDSGPE